MISTRWRRLLFLPAALFCLAFPIVALLSAPSGKTGPDALRLVGRFHMIALHMPIGLLLTLPILEIAGWLPKYKFLKQTAPWILALGTLSAVAAAIMGYLLATNDGYAPSKLLITHMWGGVIAACLSTLALAARLQQTPRWDKIYASILALLCAVLPLAAHEGGSLTHGADYLTEFFKSRVSTPKPQGDNPVFTTQILPIFQKHCTQCHGAEKAKGNLRLDAYAELKKSDESLLNPQSSELIRRITLPSDDPEAMPPDGKNPLAPADIQALKQWVQNGARE